MWFTVDVDLLDDQTLVGALEICDRDRMGRDKGLF